MAVGKPLLLGLTVLGAVLALLLYLSVMVAWRWRIAAALAAPQPAAPGEGLIPSLDPPAPGCAGGDGRVIVSA